VTLALGLAVAARASAAFQGSVVYGRIDGEELKLDANVPDGSGPFVGVILVHGGSWVQGDKGGSVRPLFEPLTRAGYAWFSINYRLAPKYRYPACLDDLDTAIAWVRTHAVSLKIDPNRIVLMGESAGGSLVEMAAMQGQLDPGIAAVVSFYGRTDFVGDPAERMGSLAGSVAALFGCTGLDPATAAELRQASPLYCVRSGLPPFLLLHGTADPIVPYDHSLCFEARLRAVGVSCDLITVPGGCHGMTGWNKVMPDYAQRMVDWLNRTLAPKSASAPEPAKLAGV
jgi:acetyl esterase/lipase